jgi:murein DD-endopeptidase MepM/ murein hydrolase activator NlpD
MFGKVFRSLWLRLGMVALLAILFSYAMFNLGQTPPPPSIQTINVVATADLSQRVSPSQSFAALDPALTPLLLSQNPLQAGAETRFLPAELPSIGRFLPNSNPADPQYELLPPPPSLDPLDNELVGDFSEIPIISEAVGIVEITEYGGEGCAPAGLPTSGVLTQRFHGYHTGIDIGVPIGTPLIATHSGTVAFAGWSNNGYGYILILQNAEFITYYAHLTNFNVRAGEVLGAGSLIGWSGSTGNSTGPHVHYETRINDGPVDPLSFEARGYLHC